MSNASMRDIYLNPTIAKLAAHLGQASGEEPAPAAAPEPFHVPSDLAYYGCGALQLLFFAVYGLLGLWLFDLGVSWADAAIDDPIALYLRSVVAVAASFVGLTAVSIIAKWLLIGRFKVESIPIWSLHYFRFWTVKTLIRSAPVALFAGHPIYNVYLRLLGAKIGRNVLVKCQFVPVCTDLITIGNDTILRKDSIVLGYRAQSNFIHTGPVSIGDDAFVGEGSVLDIDTAMGDDTQLGHASCLHSGQRVPDGERWHGSPAVPTTADYCAIERRPASPLRRLVYDVLELAGLFAIAASVPMVLLLTWENQFGGADVATDTGFVALAGSMLAASAVVFWGSLLASLAAAFVVPRICRRFLEPGRTYSTFGIHYWLQTVVAKLTNSEFFNLLFGDSSAAVHWLRFLGWNLNAVEQTGSNIGTNQKHDNPFLCDIGSGTMVSDKLSMINVEMSSSSFRLAPARIGERNYLGNEIRFPPGGRTGDNCLLGTKTMIPVDGPVRENVGLMGSPCFEIPRMVDRDKRLLESVDAATRQQRLRQKNRHNFVTGAVLLLRQWMLLFASLVIWQLALLAYPQYGVFALFAATVLISCAAVLSFVFVGRACLGFRRLQPRMVTIYDRSFWGHERYWKLTESYLLFLFTGTPFQNLLLRMMGVRLGRKVYNAGCSIAEFTLTEIGDYANLNEHSCLQAHSLEEGVFKSDHIRMGMGCTLGPAAFVHYGVRLGDHVVLDADTFLMKGEVLDAYTTWRGNPAKLFRRRAVADGALGAAVYQAPDTVGQDYRIAAE